MAVLHAPGPAALEPAALGAAIANPGRQVVALVGDGGLMFSVQELATAAAERICLPVVVFVNGGYGEIRAQMRQAGIAPVGVDLPVPDFVARASAQPAAPQSFAADLSSATERRSGAVSPTVM